MLGYDGIPTTLPPRAIDAHNHDTKTMEYFNADCHFFIAIPLVVMIAIPCDFPLTASLFVLKSSDMQVILSHLIHCQGFFCFVGSSAIKRKGMMLCSLATVHNISTTFDQLLPEMSYNNKMYISPCRKKSTTIKLCHYDALQAV